MDNVFIERLWRSLKYECVYLAEFATGSQARTGIKLVDGLLRSERRTARLRSTTGPRRLAYTDGGAAQSPGRRPVSEQPKVRLNHEPGFHLSRNENLSKGWGPPLTAPCELAMYSPNVFNTGT